MVMNKSLPLALTKMKGCRKQFVLTEPSEKSTTLNCVGNVYIKKYRSDVGTHLYHRNADVHQYICSLVPFL